MILKVSEIFNSISGEWSIYGQGATTTFLRLAECNLKENRCWYCDTDFKVNSGMEYNDLLKLLLEKCQQTGHLCITGGEPLLQMEAVEQLVKQVPKVWIETNGTIDFTPLIKKVSLVADYKIHIFKGYVPEYYFCLTERDCVKFVVENKEDLETAIEVHKILALHSQTKVAYSPVQGKNDESNNLVPFIVKRLEKEKLIGYINLQIHKYLGLK